MSSASSYFSEVTRSSSSSSAVSDDTEVESRFDGEFVTTNLSPRADGTSCSVSLSDTNDRSWWAAAAKGPSLTAAAGNEDVTGGGPGLLPRERIHRYIDQCVPPDMIAHQRATDGRVLVQLCEELVQLGGPDVWSARLPPNIFCGSVQPSAPAKDEMDLTDSREPPACVADGALYCSEDVPATWETDMQYRDVAALPADQVPWESLTCHLHQLVTRLNRLITREGGHFPCYTLPFRLQARVTPVLYAWATSWPLVQANVRCWASVVKAFHASCGAHQPPKAGSSAASTTAASPASSSPSPPQVEPSAAEVDVAAESVSARSRYCFSLPWQPLAGLFLAALEPTNSRLVSWSAVVSAVRRELPQLCRRASPFFTPEAVDGLWGLICTDLQRSPQGVAALSLFVLLVPYRHLCEAATPQPRSGGSDEMSEDAAKGNDGGEGEAAVATAPRLTTRARSILHFLLVEAAAWSPPTPSNPPLATGPKRSNGRHRPRRLLLPWRNAVVFFVSSLARAHPAAAGLDDYAESLFTSWLAALALPVGSAAGMTGASAAAAVSRIVRGSGAGVAAALGGGAGWAAGQGGATEAKSSQIEWTAAPYVRLLNAFPDNADSSLWRQLERWIHATSVLVRPGLPCSLGSAAERVCECYCQLAREALRRVPRGRAAENKGNGGRQDTTHSDISVAAGNRTSGTAPSTPRALPARYWSSATIDKFVQLFLPLAVSAFQTRAKPSVDFLVCLLYMSPTIALPALLKCVDAGLNSPTEVAEQRRISSVLLTHTIVTLFTDDERFGTAAVRQARETVTDYFQNCVPLLLSLVSPSTPEIAYSVLALLGVAITYIPTARLMRSPYEAEALGTEYASRVIPLFTERAAEKSRRPHATRQKHIEAFISALPPSALAMVARAVLREAQNRDHGSRMCPLVRMVAMAAPAEAWKCAEQTWLPALLDPSAGDGEVEWAGTLLDAAVAELGERRLTRAHASEMVAAVHAQLRFLTSKSRRGVAVRLTHAFVASLLCPRGTAASLFQRPKWRCRAASGDRADVAAAGAANATPYSDEGSALSLSTHASPVPADAPRTGAATEARVNVEWPDPEADVRVAVDFFNDALRDIVHVLTHANSIRVCSPATAAAAVVSASASSSSLSRRFLAAPGDSAGPAAASPAAEPRCVSESASAVNPHSVLEGTLEWLLRLLEIFEWLYVEPSPPVTACADAAVAAAKKGVYWGDINPRAAWKPVRLPDGCRPAFSRAELFEVAYRHLCLPLICHHVLAPLRKVGVELLPLLAPVLPLLETTALGSVAAAAPDSPLAGIWQEEDSVVDWNCVRGLLRWLVLSGIDCPQHFWLPHENFFSFWSAVSSRNPSCRSRKKMPVSGWASRVLQLHIEASVAGYLPVAQETLSRTVSVLQSLTFSPREAIRSSSLHLLLHDMLIASLSAESLVLFVRRQRALSMALLARWQALQDEGSTAQETKEEEENRGAAAVPVSAPVAPTAAAGAGGPPPSEAAAQKRVSASAAPSAAAALSLRSTLYILQESSSGTLFLIAMLTIQNLFTKAPWWGLRAWHWLMTYPEELRTVSTARLLPMIQRTYDVVPPAGTTTSRSPAYVEEVVQLANCLVAAHPTRAVVLLTLALRLYWPASHQWVSLHVVRLLARMSASVHVEVRSRATELLSAMAVHVTLREPLVPVYLLYDTELGEDVPRPPTFLLSEDGVAQLADEKAREQHRVAVCVLQASLQRLADVLPLLPQYIKDKGQVFPMCTVVVPRSAAVAAGLPVVSADSIATFQSGFVETPSLVNDLAAALPPDASPSYHRQWSEVLLGPQNRTADTRDSSTADAAVVRGGSGVASSWALQVLTLSIERPLAGMAQEASPFSLIGLLASAYDGSTASTQRMAHLLAWAEDQLQRWGETRVLRHVGTNVEGAGTVPATTAVNDDDDGTEAEGVVSRGAGPRSVEEDEMYRLFLSVLAVAVAVVRFSSHGPCAAENVDASLTADVAALRVRAQRLFASLLTCLCCHAAVPYVVMRFIMTLGMSSVCHFLSVDETWMVFAAVSAELRARPSGALVNAGEQPAAEMGTTSRDADDGSSKDTWSQRQLRLCTVVLNFVLAVPPFVTAALLSRLVGLVSVHARTFFMSPANQVRECTSRLIARMITMGHLRSRVCAEYSHCYPAARHLLSALLEKVNTQVFKGTLPFTSVGVSEDESDVTKQTLSRQSTTATSAPSFSPAAAPESSQFTSPGVEDVALLTTTALVLQTIPLDIFVDAVDDVLMLLCYCLDLSFTKVQHLHDTAEAALRAVATSWLPKVTAHRLLEHLCAICTGATGYGLSRRSKVACTRALRFAVFRNLHRIGKYAMMLQVGDAALAALAHRDAGVRGEGSQLFAILTKVASEAQTRVMVQAIDAECRSLSKKVATTTPSTPPPHVQSAPAQLSEEASLPSSPFGAEDAMTNISMSGDPTHNRRIAVVQALGAVVLADPGTPSPYVPRLMETLASCAREGNTECGRYAKRVFEQWWHAHREGWEQEYKKYFTPEQLDGMTDLLLAPCYYA